MFFLRQIVGISLPDQFLIYKKPVSKKHIGQMAPVTVDSFAPVLETHLFLINKLFIEILGRFAVRFCFLRPMCNLRRIDADITDASIVTQYNRIAIIHPANRNPGICNRLLSTNNKNRYCR